MGEHSDPKKQRVPNGVFGNEARAVNDTAASASVTYQRPLHPSRPSQPPEGVGGRGDAVEQGSSRAAPRSVHSDGTPALHGNQSGTYRVDRARDTETRALDRAIESELKTWSEPGLRGEDIEVDVEVDEAPSVIVDWRAAGAGERTRALEGDVATLSERRGESDWGDDATTASGWRPQRQSTVPPKPRNGGAWRWASVAVVAMLLAGAVGLWWRAAGTPSDAPAVAKSHRAKPSSQGERDPARVQPGNTPPASGAAAARNVTARLGEQPSNPPSRRPTRPRQAAVERRESRATPSAPRRQSPATSKRPEPGPRPSRTRDTTDEAPERATAPAMAEARPMPASGSESAASGEAKAANPRPESLSRTQVRAGLESLRSRIQACAGGRHGVAEARVTIASSGTLMHADIGDDFRGTQQGSCMARALRGASFPAFENGPLNVRYPFSL